MNKILTQAQRAEFTKLVRKTKNIDEKDRLRAILAYDLGHDASDIAEILQISESTTYNYINDYLNKNKIAHLPKNGALCKLTPSQEIELINHLHEVTYLYAKSICAYVLKTYQVKYTVAGITKWLERNEFVHKEPKLVPGKLNTQKQEQFIEHYTQLKNNLQPNETIMFMDAVHPEYQSQAVYGWIPKGIIKTLPTTNKQFRLHINGAIEPFSHKAFIQEYDTINAESIISFFKQLELQTPYKTIHIICDNGRANKNKELAAYLSQTTRIKIHYLPAYSPNLNLIERLWKILREYTCYNKCYPVFADFANAIRGFFDDTIHKIPDILKTRLIDKFEVIRHNPVQLSS